MKILRMLIAALLFLCIVSATIFLIVGREVGSTKMEHFAGLCLIPVGISLFSILGYSMYIIVISLNEK
jgi:hypothetical protein